MNTMDWQLNRKSKNCCAIDNNLGLDVNLFANEDVLIDNIVTAIDPKSPQMQMRKDILSKYKERIKEAPYAYKPITPIIESITDSNIARVIGRLMSLCTVKSH
jgi:hypothetical protein